MLANIKFPVYRPTITNLERDYISEAVSSGWVSSIGKYIQQFEDGFARFCGAKYCVSVSNGTNAIFLALKALGIGPGDEVIVPDFSFIATANAVQHTGATPVFVDIDAETLCMAPNAFKDAITSRTRIVMPVHIYGHPAPMHEIMEIAEARGITVIEDCAEAHGASIRGRQVGSWGTAGVFSFYGNKILTTGEGGAIVLSDPVIDGRLRLLRDHAMSPIKRYWHEEVGYNFRLTNLQAALGVAQLERASEIIEKKRKIFDWYARELRPIQGIRLNRKADWAEPVYWMICLELDFPNAGFRHRFMMDLKERGVDTRPYFYPMSTMPMYETSNTPVSQTASSRGINLPSYFELTEEDVIEICCVIREVISCLEY